MAQQSIDPNTSNTNAVHYDMLFFVKGSYDYPYSQIITKPFGYDAIDSSNNELPIFKTSLAELYKKLDNPKVIENLYSLYSDTTHGISQTHITADKTLRNEFSKEYLSTIVVNHGEPSPMNNPYVDHIDPNYSFDYNNNLGGQLSAVGNNVNTRENIFWQKMFTLIEFIKKYESNIIEDNRTNALPSIWLNKKDPGSSVWTNDYFNGDETSVESKLLNETTAGRYIALFVGNNVSFSTIQEKFGKQFNIGTAELDSANDTWGYNPFRTEETCGGAPTTRVDKIEDMMWHKGVVDIQYVPLSARYTVSSSANPGRPRLATVSFTVSYQYSDDTQLRQTVDLTVYFTPDDMVSSAVTNTFKVFTYNDIDLDKNYPEGANPYDNDYSNVLSKDETVKNNFVVNKREMSERIVEALASIYREGQYDGHVVYSTRRVSPIISPTGEDVLWLDENSTNQDFWVFYRGSEPSIAQQMAVVQDYLMILHKDCQPTTYNEDGKTIRFIGHTQADKRNFLAKMYPNLFTETNVHIIPIGVQMYKQSGSTVGGSYNPEAYYHSATLDRIYQTLRSYKEFDNFKFSPEGGTVMTEETQNQSNLPVEVIYTGGLNVNPGVGDPIEFNFPWFVTTKGENTTVPLTGKPGFADYRQRWFTSADKPINPADILQYILLVLSIDMFVENKATMARRRTICGINIEYAAVQEKDSGTNEQAATEVSFIINSVKFTVHAQVGKNFGLLTNRKDKEDL